MVTQEHVDHYARSAGPGLCIVEATAMSPEGRLAATQIGAWSDEQVDGLARLAATIHGWGGIAGIQVHHAGIRGTKERNGGLPTLVPTLGPDSPEGAVELTSEAIRGVIDAFAAATKRCIDAGFDLIELHGAHGYLGSQFLSPASNRRRDEWGGPIENRARFLVECVRAARAKIESAGRPVVLAVRLGLADGGDPPLTVDDGCSAAQMLADAGVELFDVSNGGSQPSRHDEWTRATTLELARIARSRVDRPVIGVGGVKGADQAEELLESGVADLVAVGRAILADQQWAAKIIDGRADQIDRCIDCKPRCFHFTEPEKCPPRRAQQRR
ncbi:MAG: NADH:flavin oxidoreductase/NADH oxidase [Spirochaetaceae bacterium]|nr:MAG: NADH:flavin oxidoreductase/NADH oxidase [Spirochaetaceae bacterium]